MDWEDAQAKPPKQIVVGAALDEVSVAELEERILALKAEILRVEKELRLKRQQSAAADQLFKS